MNRRIAIPLAVALLAVLLVVGAALAQGGPAIAWWVISGGGAPSTGGNVTLNDTLGQPIVGQSAVEPTGGSGHAVCSGFWCGIPAEYRVYLPLVLRNSP
jgi:hypothetical protein